MAITATRKLIGIGIASLALLGGTSGVAVAADSSTGSATSDTSELESKAAAARGGSAALAHEQSWGWRAAASVVCRTVGPPVSAAITER
ncbi:hypothetical protein OIE63_00505 [Streptomyces sp. NBC_01795]|uniref:hypothetical protein n=1 Tax=unclassified Streptomyces TaxID=2593676 RepID=UPI002DD97027|nr:MULTISPECIES: hypothetical protein [unclassified Streptomyces]WSA90178.1 hypothetical protein OIE63_00505 [Streptomyces sp. NBC_01795]WSS17211.1 hypothetical protein OG533_38895 [Streptomyces sp. NBC_01186]